MSNSNAATVVYRGVGVPTVVVDTNASRLVIHRLDSETEARRWGHSIDHNGRIRGIIRGCMTIGDAFVVQEIRDCEDVTVWRGGIDYLRNKYGSRVSELLESEIIHQGVDTGNCTAGEIRLVNGPPRNIDWRYSIPYHIRVANVIIRNPVYAVEEGTRGLCDDIPDPSGFVFRLDITIVPYDRSLLVYGLGATRDPPHPHIDASGRMCISNEVLHTAHSLIRSGMRAEAVMIIIEALRNLNLNDCYGYFRGHFGIDVCYSCHRWSTSRKECQLCGRCVCNECFGSNDYCGRCMATAVEFELLRPVNAAAGNMIAANMLVVQHDQMEPPDDLRPADIARATRYVSMPYDYDRAWVELRYIFRQLDWRRVFNAINTYINHWSNEDLREQQRILIEHVTAVGYNEVYCYDVPIPSSTEYWTGYESA